MGSWGWNCLTNILRNFLNRLPHRLNVRAMGDLDVMVSAGTIHNALLTIGMLLGDHARKIRDACRLAEILGADETIVSYNGNKVWLWIFYNPLTGDAFYTIRYSRGNDVPKDVLGDWDGYMVCDGWHGYDGYQKQRCWSHILGDIKLVAERNPECAAAWEVKRRVKAIFATAVEAAKLDESQRRVYRRRLHAKVVRIVAKYHTDKSRVTSNRGTNRRRSFSGSSSTNWTTPATTCLRF